VVVPPRQHEGPTRPDWTLVNVNGTESPAFGTVAPENFLHLPVNHVPADFLGSADDVSVGEDIFCCRSAECRNSSRRL